MSSVRASPFVPEGEQTAGTDKCRHCHSDPGSGRRHEPSAREAGYLWAVIQLPSEEGGVFRVAPSIDCIALPDFFGERAKEAFDTGRATVVDMFRSREAAEHFTQQFMPDVARGIWDWYKKLAGPH